MWFQAAAVRLAQSQRDDVFTISNERTPWPVVLGRAFFVDHERLR
jgi:hypothetical protein